MADKKPPLAALDPSCTWMSDRDAAALQALAKLPYDKREYAGAIYRREGLEGLLEYCHSTPVEGRQDNFAFRTDKSNGLAFDSIYHSHPANGRNDEDHFSHNDVTTADTLKRPSYIRANESGDVKRYDPGASVVDKARRTGRPGEFSHTSAGTLVGNVKTRREELAAAFADAEAKPNK